MLYLTTKLWLIVAAIATLFGAQMECAKVHQEELSQGDHPGPFV
jgi:hypothetical protein